MIIFFYLTFGHFLADFVLQPTNLVRWKFQDWKGTVVHSLIHFMMYLAVLPMLGFENGLIFLIFLILAGSHFLIDNVKIRQEKRGEHFLRYFAVDQAVHLGLLGFVAYWLTAVLHSVLPSSGFEGFLYSHVEVPIGLSLLIIVTSVVEIAKYQSLRQKKSMPSFRPDYRAMMVRGAVFTVLYSFFLILGVYHAAAMV